MAVQEDPKLTSSHGHNKITTIYRATIDESDLKTRRKGLLQPKIERRNHNVTGSGVEMAYSQDPYPLDGDPQIG